MSRIWNNHHSYLCECELVMAAVVQVAVKAPQQSGLRVMPL